MYSRFNYVYIERFCNIYRDSIYDFTVYMSLHTFIARITNSYLKKDLTAWLLFTIISKPQHLYVLGILLVFLEGVLKACKNEYMIENRKALPFHLKINILDWLKTYRTTGRVWFCMVLHSSISLYSNIKASSFYCLWSCMIITPSILICKRR